MNDEYQRGRREALQDVAEHILGCSFGNETTVEEIEEMIAESKKNPPIIDGSIWAELLRKSHDH